MPVLHGEQHYGAKLTNTLVQQIRNEYEPGQISYTKLAERYSVDKSTISRVISRTIWKHLPEPTKEV